MGGGAQRNALPRFLGLYALLFASFGVASPFLPAFIEARGLPAEQIGLIFAAGTSVRLISTLIVGRLADRWQARRSMLAACCAAAAVAAILYLPASTLGPILLVSLLHAMALAPLTPLSDALAVVAANRPHGQGFEYGWVRGTGSGAFIVGSILVGWAIAGSGLEIIVWWQAALLLAAAAAALLVPEIRAERADDQTITGEAFRVLWNSAVFRRIVLVAALILGSHGMHDTFAMIRWSAAGTAPQTASLLWSLAVVAEVVVFLLIGPPLVHRLTPAGCMMVAAVAGALRWAVAAVSADVLALALIQPLHGITFALLHLACMQLIATHVPSQLVATAQAVYGAVGIGAATAVVTLASGWLYARMGGAAFLIMSLLCLAALPLALNLRRQIAMEQEGR